MDRTSTMTVSKIPLELTSMTSNDVCLIDDVYFFEFRLYIYDFLFM